MELHFESAVVRALKIIGIGLAGVAVGVLGLLLGGPLGGVLVVFGWLLGGLILVFGLVVLGNSFRSSRIAFSEAGLVVDHDGQRFEGSWDLVDAISIERVPTEEERHTLVLWVADGVPMKHQPTFPPDADRKGHALVELAEIKESREELAAILSRYAGAKFRSAASLG